MKNKINQRVYYTPFQFSLPVEIENVIEFSDPVYSFCEVLNHIDLKKYLVVRKHMKGRRRYDEETLLRIILFAFMENGYASTRAIEKSCKTDIRYMWLLNGLKAPSHMKIDNFMNDELNESIENILSEINAYIFEQENVDCDHTYIDGTKIVANANKYSWVWKKSSAKNRDKTFVKISALIEEMNKTLFQYGVKIDPRTEYAIEYLEEISEKYACITGIDQEKLIRGRGHHKPIELRYYDELVEYTKRLKKYSDHIRICGDFRNSFSKTDNDATFMRMKQDHMGNDRLLPGYNIQLALCDEFIAAFDVKQYASDMDCFIPLMERFKKTYGKYPKYPVADAGYGSFNNYLYCEEHGMEKYMKFTMYSKETEDEKYRNDPYRAVNFRINENGNPVCPNNKEFHYLKTRPVKGNQYGRTEELYICEDCTDCQLKNKCCKCEGNRVVQINRELTQLHKEVIHNLNSIHGALLRMNRSIQAEGAFGTIKWNRDYTRARRRGLKGLIFEVAMISCGFNLHKYYLKKLKKLKVA